MAFDGDPQAYEKDLCKQLTRRLTSLAADRESWEPHWEEVGRYTQPRLGRFLRGAPITGNNNRNKGAEANARLLDSRGIWASQVLANGMSTGLTSSSMPWFKLKTEDEDLNDYYEVKAWLAEVEKRIYDLFAKTNFYSAQKSSYLDIGVFGTSGTLMVADPIKGAVCFPLSIGEYWIATDHTQVADTLYRRVDMTARQMAQAFGPDVLPTTVKADLTADRIVRQHQVFHAIEPNPDRQPGKIDRLNQRYRSVYWTKETGDREGASGTILSRGGFRSRPFWAPRWDVDGNDTYGYSPGMIALPDLRQLQLQKLRKSQATDYAVRPAMRAPVMLGTTHANLQPGGITTMPGADKDSFGPLWQVDVRAIELIREDVADSHQAIDRAFYADLFMAITNMPGVQPRNLEEIARRNEEKLGQLGPAVDRNGNEQLRVAIDRAFDILDAAGQLPPAPPDIHGMELIVEFTSILAQMQRAVGLGSMERGVAFMGNLAAAKPDVMDNLDEDEAIREYFDRVGAPPKMLRNPRDVAADRAARAKQQQMATMAAAMPAVKDGADAAKLLSQTDTGDGNTMLSRMYGNAA